MATGYSITTTLNAAAATVAADTYSNNTDTPGTNWSFASGSAHIPSTTPSADFVVIENNLTVSLWVCATGALLGAVTQAGQGGTTLTAGAASTILIPANDTQPFTIMNIQPQPNWNVKTGVATYASGYVINTAGSTKFNDGANDQSFGWNLTAQSGFSGTHNTGHWPFGPNFLAFIPSAAATGAVTITFQ